MWIVESIYFAPCLYSIPLVSGLIYFRRVERSIKVTILLIVAVFVFENIALYTSIKYRSNTQVYHIFNMIELIFYGAYFNEFIAYKKRNFILKVITFVSISAACINLYFFQPWTAFNTNFVLFEGLIVIGLSLWALAQMFIDNNELNITANANFWMCMVFLVYWCTSYFSWALYNVVGHEYPKYFELVSNIIIFSNVFCYISMALIFFLASRKTSAYEG